jgi:RNA polymerase sigma-70 factor (ECF subfamily)
MPFSKPGHGSPASTAAIENLGGWLKTVVARVCLDMLCSRASRREEALKEQLSEPAVNRQPLYDPEHDALFADSVGPALLVALDRLTPAERIAFFLHDMFDVSFDEIAAIAGRSPTAARQLASRARRRMQGAGTPATVLGHALRDAALWRSPRCVGHRSGSVQ